VYTYIYCDFKWARPITARIMSYGTNANKSKVYGGLCSQLNTNVSRCFLTVPASTEKTYLRPAYAAIVSHVRTCSSRRNSFVAIYAAVSVPFFSKALATLAA
jgi:hypothetical protein